LQYCLDNKPLAKESPILPLPMIVILGIMFRVWLFCYYGCISVPACLFVKSVASLIITRLTP